MTDSHQPGSAGTFGGIFLGAVIGLVVSVLVAVPVGYTLVKKKQADVRRGWNLVPVVVAASDIAEGKVLTFDLISQRSVPEQFVTSSVVKPDRASHIVNQRILVSVQAGDPLLWSQFQAGKKRQGLAAARDVPAGAALAEADLADGEFPDSLLTASYVRQPERPQVVPTGE